jgi:hypothetical protein
VGLTALLKSLEPERILWINDRFVWVRNLVSYIKGETDGRVCENKLLRRIFGPKSNEVTGGWRELHNEELHDLYSSKVQLE